MQRHGAADAAWTGDPVEVALAEMAMAADPGLITSARTAEIAFDANRRRMSTVHDTPSGRVLYCKGAPEVVLASCARLARDGTPLLPERRAELLAAQDAMARRGLHVLALAIRPLAPDQAPVEDDLSFVGFVGLADPPRPGVAAAIARCRQAGVRVVMATGDHPRTAQAVGRQLGLLSDTARIVTGAELANAAPAQLQRWLDEPELAFARVAADQKLRIVHALRARGDIVAVTGDGVNDAPALKAAHVGIAMGRGGTDVARAAADIVLLDDDFASIPAAIEEGRAIHDNIRKFLTYQLAHNVAELVPYLAASLGGFPLALTPIQMLAVDMGTDSLCGLGLGCEPPDADTMRRPPRPPDAPLLDRSLALRAYLFLGPIEAVAAMCVFLFALSAGTATSSPGYRSATTACLATIVAVQIANALSCRSERRSAFASGQPRNRLVAAGIALALAVFAVIAWTAPGHAIFGSAPPSFGALIAIGPIALAALLAEEGRKAWTRRRMARPPR